MIFTLKIWKFFAIKNALKMKTLETLIFHKERLGLMPLAIKIFSLIMKLNQRIRTIELGDNGLGFASFQNFRTIMNLIEKQKQLEKLFLNDNNLGIGNPENLQLFFNFLSYNNNISTLYITNNAFGNAVFENVNNLVKALYKNKSIKKLAISEKGWSDTNKKILQNALENISNISEYALSFIGCENYDFKTKKGNE